MKNRGFIVASLGALAFLAWGADVSGQSTQSIGSVTAVQREVNLSREGRLEVELVKLADPVLFKDLYETKAKSKLKLLFEDDSLLTLGENTSLRITENIYDPTKGHRSTVINMVDGTIRALVGKIFTGAGSKFEIHTPTAAAAARGTYFIIWTVNGRHAPAGVVNIGESGKVVVSNINPAIEGSVELGQNEYTLVEENAAPTRAAKIKSDLLNRLLASTEIKDQAVEEVPKGMEAPGSDISMEMVVPIPVGPVVGGEPSTSEIVLAEEGGAEVEYPTVPPIVQQPNPGEPPVGGGGQTTPVTVDVIFPGGE